MSTAETMKGPHGHDYGPVAQALRECGPEPIIYVPNPGNAGDGLIALGTYILFEKLGISWQIGRSDGVYPDRSVVYGGGGSLIELYPRAIDFLKSNHPVCRRLVLLPHTIRAFGDVIAAMDDRCTLFARDKDSHAYLSGLGGTARTGLGHDMAFMISRDDLVSRRLDPGFLSRPGIRIAWLKMVTKILWHLRFRDSRLHAMRGDREAPGGDLPAANFDLSAMFSSGHLNGVSDAHMSPTACATTAKILQLILERASLVETNRLHIAVLSAVLGRNLVMRDNSYGKNRGVYDHSMKDVFPDIAFQAEEAAGARALSQGR